MTQQRIITSLRCDGMNKTAAELVFETIPIPKLRTSKRWPKVLGYPKPTKPMKRLLTLLLLPLFGLLITACNRTGGDGDVRFARSAFESLVRGEEAVAADIDWKMLQSLGINVGAEYVSLQTEEERARFREAFITQFASSFQATGARAEDFTDWAVAEDDDVRTTVVARGPGGVLTLTLNDRDGGRKLSGIDSAPR